MGSYYHGLSTEQVEITHPAFPDYQHWTAYRGYFYHVYWTGKWFFKLLDTNKQDITPLFMPDGCKWRQHPWSSARDAEKYIRYIIRTGSRY